MAGAEGGRGSVCGVLAARQAAELLEAARHVVQAARLVQVDRNAHRLQAGEMGVAVAAAPADHQVGAQADDGFEIDLGVAADLGQGAGGLRIVAVGDDADHVLAGTGGEQDLGDVRREADDALRRLREHDALAGVVGEFDLRAGDGGVAEQQRGEQGEERAGGGGAGVWHGDRSGGVERLLLPAAGVAGKHGGGCGGEMGWLRRPVAMAAPGTRCAAHVWLAVYRRALTGKPPAPPPVAPSRLRPTAGRSAPPAGSRTAAAGCRGAQKPHAGARRPGWRRA